MKPRECIEEIVRYTRSHPELMQAHHFLFDLPVNENNQVIEYIVIGINPGESKKDKKIIPNTVHEETSRYDFRKVNGVRPNNSRRWFDLSEEYCGSKKVILSEVFLWSSRNTSDAFEERYGKRIWFCTEHLRFCREMNLHLVKHYQPKAVILPGLTAAETIANLYELSHQKTYYASNGHRLVERFVDKNAMPWVFTKHWSGARGFTKDQQAQVTKIIAEL